MPDDLRRRFDFSRDGVLRSLESSLDRLGVSQVDIVYVHDPDEHVDQAIAEAIPALTELRDQGVVGAVGAGMNQWQALQRIIRETDLDVVMLAGRWTLLDRSGASLLAACAERGAAAPYNSGLLAQDWPSPDTHFNYGQPHGRSSSRLGRWPASASDTAHASRPQPSSSPCGTRRSPRWSPGCGQPLRCVPPCDTWPSPYRTRRGRN